MTIGLLLTLSPLLVSGFSQIWLAHQSGVHETTAKSFNKDKLAKMKTAAESYNEKLLDSGTFLTEAADSIPGYSEDLNLMGDSVMGTLKIPKIGLTVPVYHGTSEATLVQGVGHLQGSSLPVGGKGTHAVLTGHRGLPSAMLFTRLDEIKKGDTFELDVLDTKLHYEVDQIEVIWPYQTDRIKLNPEADEVTLVTCTPFGVNNKRLLVKGHRVSKPKKQVKASPLGKVQWMLLGLSALLLTGLLFLLLWGRHRRKQEMEKKG